METQVNKKSMGDTRPAEDVEQQSSHVSVEKNDLLQQEHTDPVLNAKMHLVNNVSPGEPLGDGSVAMDVMLMTLCWCRRSMRLGSLGINGSCLF